MTYSTQPEETSFRVPRRWERLAWLPILLLTVSMAGFWVVDLRTEYEWPRLQIALNFVTRTLACLYIAFLAGRGFLARRQPGLLLLGCGVVIWGTSGFITTALVSDVNYGVTISNLGLWAAALCHLTGVILSLKPRRLIPAAGFRLALGYALSLGLVALISLATFSGWFPLFFLDGQGGTLIRHLVLGMAFGMFALTAATLWENNRQKFSSFKLWYSYALMLIAVGVFGMLIQTSRGSMLNWMCRISQYLSGIYMLIAALAAKQTSPVLDVFQAPEEAWRGNRILAALRQQTTLGMAMRYALALAVVAVAMGLRLGLEKWVGLELSPYVTFYPAMMAVVVFTGFGPGVLATLLIVLITGYRIMPPVGELVIASHIDRLGLVVFTSTNLLMCLAAEIYRGNQEKAVAYDRDMALRESEERLRFALESCHIGAWDIDLFDNTAYRSLEYGRIFGYEAPLPEWTLDMFLQHVLPEYRAKVETMIRVATAAHASWTSECRIRRTDGEIRWIWVSGRYTTDISGRSRATGIVQDITERKQAEIGLREREADLNEAQRLAHLGSWHWDATTDITTGSNELLRLYGFDPATQTMPNFQDQRGRCYPVEDWERINSAVQRCLETGVGYELDVRVIRNGGVIWATTRGEAVRDANGLMMGLRGTVQDINERKRTEEALALTQKSIDSAAEMVAWFTPDGKVHYVNDATCRTLGYSRDELLQMTALDFSPNFTWEQYREHWREVRERNSFSLETTHCRKDGSEYPAEVLVNYILFGGKEYLFAYGRDITDRKRAEDDLRKLNEDLENMVVKRTAELREKDQMLLAQSRQAAMGEMIGNIAHQWRQPLNTLGLTIQRLELYYELGKFTEEFLANNVGASMNLIQYMSKTIDDFRNYFKPDKEKIEFKVREAVENTLTLIGDSFRSKHIVVEVTAQGDPVLYGYKNEFAQGILNILNNAGDVLLERETEQPKVTITFGNEADRSFVTIADNGGGISEEIIHKVFDPYFTTKGPQQGTGIGLYMSKTIMEKNMGGKLTVRNLAEGAEFRIEV